MDLRILFLKKDSDLQSKYDALTKLNKEYPNNEELLEELYVVKEGLAGESELAEELSKANMGMYVLRDVKVKFEDLTAQINYVLHLIKKETLLGN